MTILHAIRITASVGRGGRNKSADVRLVQGRLNDLMGPSRERLTVDGISGAKTRSMIGDFQRNVLGFRNPDERVDPAGKTIRALNDTESATLWRRVSPDLALDVTVPGHVPALAQPSSMACWATVATMLISWRQGRSMTIPEALGSIGGPWLANFRNNRGLLWTQTAAFANAAGMRMEPLESLTAEGFADILARWRSPLFTSIHPAGNPANTTHFVVVLGIRGDGSPDGTQITLIDPIGGVRRTQTYGQFQARYEASERSSLAVQILHY